MGALTITVSTHAGLFVWQAKYKERGTVLAEDQLAQVSPGRKGDGTGLVNMPLV